MFQKIVLLILLLSMFLRAEDVKVAVAANVSYAISDLIKEFKRSNPDINIKVTIGGSGKLTAQILYGAPFDILLSANMLYPNTLYKKNIAITKPVVYAQGALAYFSTTKKDFSQGIKIIESRNIRRIAVANPLTAPYGKATVEAMKNAKLFRKNGDKFIYGESISSTLSFALKVTDMGFIAKSLLYSPKMKRFKENIHYKELDSSLYTPINQGIVLLKVAKNNQSAREFYNFLLSDRSKKILIKFGYKVP